MSFLDIIYRNTKRLKKLSEAILEISKVENNLFNLNKEQFNTKELIQNLTINYKKQVKTKNIGFEFVDSFDNYFSIYADKTRISQVISNLINNSMQFIPDEKGGTISITVEKGTTKDNDEGNAHGGSDGSNNHMVVITIKDNGVGIDSDILPLLFTKFEPKSFHGTGLGLYICKNIIEAHSGKVWARNNEDGRGATFVFSLPTYSKRNY